MPMALSDQHYLRTGLFLGFAVLLHFLAFHLTWQLPKALQKPVKIQTVSPELLQRYKKDWVQKQKQLVMHPAQPKEEPKSKALVEKEARYESDRRIRVEREEQARRSQVVATEAKGLEKKKESQQPSHTKPKLSQLGLALPMPKPVESQAQSSGEALEHADQTVLDRNLPMGSQNLLNTDESVFYAFYSRLYEAIGPIWQSRIRQVPRMRKVLPGEYVTVVEVSLDRNGNLLGIQYARQSGIIAFDEAVEASWRKIKRFPNPPRQLLNEEGIIKTGWSFSVQISEGSDFQYLPPERAY